MYDKLMYIPNDDKQTFPLCRLQLVIEKMDTQLNEQTNKYSIKVPKVLS